VNEGQRKRGKERQNITHQPRRISEYNPALERKVEYREENTQRRKNYHSVDSRS
jgi:hypothetical protein